MTEVALSAPAETHVPLARTFDAEPCLGATTADMDLRLFQVVYKPLAKGAKVNNENLQPMEQQLAGLQYLDLLTCSPTNAAIILFGTDVPAWMRDAYIQFLRVDGESLAGNVAQDHEIDGDLVSVLRKLEAVMAANILSAPRIATPLREKLVADYPLAALRELWMNAVMHRDYSSTAPLRITWFTDRIEIQSPGGLYGDATEANFPQQTSYRNPILAEALKELGYVNRYGSGVLKAQHAIAANGNPRAEFQFYANYVLVIVPARSELAAHQ